MKFANPEASIRSVHREITERMSEMTSDEDGGYSFLRNVKLNDVKKVWKKANRPVQATTKSASSSASGDRAAESGSSSMSEKLPPLPENFKGVPKLYTIGDGNVRSLAREYTEKAAAAAAKEIAKADGVKQAMMDEMMQNYVHFFLDVPADRSGTRPHQALIHFGSNDGGAGGRKKKHKQKRGGVKVAGQHDDDEREIVKIQVAAEKYTSTPMLLYNADKTAKTFIHPPSDVDGGDDGGYDQIKELIATKGIGGSLGVTGGTKAYFWSHITRRKDGSDVISVDIKSGLAPVQPW